jgi:hypothetical protein
MAIVSDDFRRGQLAAHAGTVHLIAAEMRRIMPARSEEAQELDEVCGLASDLLASGALSEGEAGCMLADFGALSRELAAAWAAHPFARRRLLSFGTQKKSPLGAGLDRVRSFSMVWRTRSPRSAVLR